MQSINKKIVTGTVAAALVLGGGFVGLQHNKAFAASTGTPASSTTLTAADNQNDGETADDAGKQDQTNVTAADNQNDGETADDTAGKQDQNNEAADLSQADLQKQAKITKEQATAIASAQVQGSVKDVQLEDENGAAVYNVQIQDSKGQVTEVKVDAATGKITQQEQADNNQQEGQDQETNDSQQ